jgi:hypothetical protein
MGDMINYTWKILKLFSEGDLITAVKYNLNGFDGTKSINSEGTYQFIDPVLTIPLIDVKESNVIEWLEEATMVDGQSHIKTGIEKQFNALKPIEINPPWMPETFTPG